MRPPCLYCHFRDAQFAVESRRGDNGERPSSSDVGLYGGHRYHALPVVWVTSYGNVNYGSLPGITHADCQVGLLHLFIAHGWKKSAPEGFAAHGLKPARNEECANSA